jgi:predicted PurR-regulated permease PerM
MSNKSSGEGSNQPADATPPGPSGSPAPKPAAEPAVPAPPPSWPIERRQRTVGWHSRDVVRTAALVIALYLAMRLLWFANALFLVAFLGLLFGLAVEAGVDRLERFRIPRGAGAAMIVLGFFGLLVGLGAMMTPTIRAQSRELRVKIPVAVDRLEEWINRRRGFVDAVLGRGSDTAAPATTPQPADTPRQRGGVVSETVAAADTQAPADSVRVGSAPTASETLRSSLGRQLGGAARYLFPFLSQTVAVVAGLLLIIFMAIYIAADPNMYHRGLMHLFPHRVRDRAGEVLSAIATVLRRWLVTQLIAMVVIGTVTTVVLLILNVEAAFALGLLAGLMEFIPTVGPILSAVPAVAMGFVDSPQKALSVAIAYMGIQFLENHLLIPLLMKGGVNVPPVLTILGQALFTLLFGFLGLMVAVPVLAAVIVTVKMLYVEGVVGDDVAVVTTRPSG